MRSQRKPLTGVQIPSGASPRRFKTYIYPSARPPTMAGKTWHERLLGDEDVRRWFQNVERGARTTADNYLRILGLSCERMGLTPAEFAGLDPKERDDRLDDYIQLLLDESGEAMKDAFGLVQPE